MKIPRITSDRIFFIGPYCRKPPFLAARAQIARTQPGGRKKITHRFIGGSCGRVKPKSRQGRQKGSSIVDPDPPPLKIVDPVPIRVSSAMQFLRKLFQPSPSPEPVFEDPTLGHMIWSEDDEAWIGAYNGFRFAFAHEGAARPSARLLSLAADVLGDAAWLANTLEDQKRQMLLELQAASGSKIPDLTSEVRGLKLGSLHFSTQQDRGYIFADVEGGHGDRFGAWNLSSAPASDSASTPESRPLCLSKKRLRRPLLRGITSG